MFLCVNLFGFLFLICRILFFVCRPQFVCLHGCENQHVWRPNVSMTKSHVTIGSTSKSTWFRNARIFHHFIPIIIAFVKRLLLFVFFLLCVNIFIWTLVSLSCCLRMFLCTFDFDNHQICILIASKSKSATKTSTESEIILKDATYGYHYKLCSVHYYRAASPKQLLLYSIHSFALFSAHVLSFAISF